MPDSAMGISTTMRKRIQGLLLLHVLANCISAEHYHIVPNDSASQCQNYSAGTCFTLAEFASNISRLDQGNNLTLSFLPGEHLLTRRLTITGPQNIALTGQISSNNSTIKCQGISGFEFGDIQSLKLNTWSLLAVEMCGMVEQFLLTGWKCFLSKDAILLIIM